MVGRKQQQTTRPSWSRMPSLSIRFLFMLFIAGVVNFSTLWTQNHIPPTEDQHHGGGVGRRHLSVPPPSSVSLSSSSSSPSSSSANAIIPYYRMGKTHYQRKPFHRKKTFLAIADETARPIPTQDQQQRVWVLPNPIQTPTRNHESIVLEYGGSGDGGDSTLQPQQQQQQQLQVLVNILGRYSRVVQWMDLNTGEQHQVQTEGFDPDQRPLNDLNHVASVVVDALEDAGHDNLKNKKEIWLPCGFHNDKIGVEQSSNYVRVVDLDTMQIRAGPKLPHSGGACGAALLEAVPDEPPLICAFGGTDGNHDTGIFLPYVACYDRLRKRWVYPLGQLPVGMDHLSVATIPAGTCQDDDPSRILVFNYRTENYSTQQNAEILAYDLPRDGWTVDQLDRLTTVEAAQTSSQRWYTWANHSFAGPEDEVYAPRDASGVVMANGGRSIVNLGGVNYVRNPEWKLGQKGKPKNHKRGNRGGHKTFATWYSTVRELDVCTQTWRKLADLGVETFALMAAASTGLNAAFFCGGAMYSQDYHGNMPWCLAVQIPGLTFWNHRTAATQNFSPGFIPGGQAVHPGMVASVG